MCLFKKLNKISCKTMKARWKLTNNNQGIIKAM